MSETMLVLTAVPGLVLVAGEDRRVRVCASGEHWLLSEVPMRVVVPGPLAWLPVARAIQAGLSADEAVPVAEVVALATLDRPARMQVLSRTVALAPWQVHVLAHDEDWWVRAALARRLVAEGRFRSVLLMLTFDDRAEVRRTLVREPGCPDWVGAVLGEDADPLVREAAALLPEAPVLRRVGMAA